MRKKMLSCLIALAFICTSLLLMTSCAKKQVKVSKAAKPTTEVKEVVEVVEEESEADRQARLRELEKAQRLAQEIIEFESESIYFDFDQSDLMPDAEASLKKKADWLRNNPSYSVRIAGNCDDRGTQEYNLALGERRAYSAKKFLLALGISGDRIATISYGEEKPAALGQNEQAWAKNRRDDFELAK